MRNLNVKGLHTFAVGEMQVLVPNTSGTDGMPRIGQELGRGAEGVVYENLDQPGWVVKEFHQGDASPLQVRNEFQNLENVRAILPDNVVKAQAPIAPRQGFLVKEQVILDTPTPAGVLEGRQIEQTVVNGGVQVAVWWLALGLGGRWSQDLNATGKLGRAVGWCWIAMAVASELSAWCFALNY